MKISLCRKRPSSNSIYLCLSLVFVLSACQFATYQPKPIQVEKNQVNLRERSPQSAEFLSYLKAQNIDLEKSPIRSWNKDLIAYCALFYHPDLDVARSQWRAAQAAIITAGQRPELGVNGLLENHSKSSGETPWTYGLGIDVTIPTAGKIEARIDRASQLSEAARINIAQTAWQVRTRAMRSLLAYQYHQQLLELLKLELDLRIALVDMLQKRVDAGIASNIDLNNARIYLRRAEQAYISELGKQASLQAGLASNIGLSLQTLQSMPLDVQWSDALTKANLEQKVLQGFALQNRLDIRSALARYEAAEASLRLEIAKQYPDFVLSPSYAFDQNDRVWSLSISSLLTLINRNRGLIAEANALRDVEASQFFALQARIIGQLDQQQAILKSSRENLKRADNVLNVQTQRFAQTQQQFDAGIADRMELTTAQLEWQIANQNKLNQSYQLQIAAIDLEDVLQGPVDSTFALPRSIEKGK